MSDCQERCPMEERIRQLELRDKHNSEEHSKFYDKFSDFGLSHKENTMNIKNIFEKMNEIGNDVKEMKESPSKTADKFKSAVVSAIGSAVGVAIIGIIAFVVVNGVS